MYSLSDSAALSHGPYLGTVSMCSLVSIILLSVKACVFTAEASRKRIQLNKSWGMPVLFLSSVVFALGHMVVAYRTSCRARRKLLYHRVDPEAVSFDFTLSHAFFLSFQSILMTSVLQLLSCKSVFSSYHKVPRSPIPLVSKIDGEARRKLLPSPSPSAFHDEGELPVRSLADLDSLFITVRGGLTVHYKICSPLQSVSSTLLPEASSMLNMPEAMAGKLKLDRNMVTRNKLNHHPHHKSYSSLFNTSSSLHDPLLDGAPLLFKDVQEQVCREDQDDMNVGAREQQDADGSGRFGLVLVHGFGGGVFSWRHVMASLAHQLGCVVTAFDRPGWGLTDRPHKKDLEERDLPNPYTLENQVTNFRLYTLGELLKTQ